MSASAAPAVSAQHTEGRFAGAGGKEIYWQAWLPAGETRAVVVVAHGVSEHGGRYRYVVERLVPEGYAVYAIDHRGHGRSAGQRAQIDRMRHLVADLDHLIDLARVPGKKLFLLGHSMGGCVSIAYALAHQDKLDGLALSAPLAALDAAPLPLRLIAHGLSIVAPGLGVYKVAGDAVSRDAAEVRAYDDDPLTFRGMLPARTVQEMADTVGRFEAEAPQLTVPLLMLIPTADKLAPPAGGRMVYERASSVDKKLIEYDGFFHEIFNEPAGERDRPLNDLADWLAAHLS